MGTARMRQLGWCPELAMGTLRAWAAKHPSPPPSGCRIDMRVRLCRDCARKAEMKVAKLGGGELPCYVQPERDAA